MNRRKQAAAAEAAEETPQAMTWREWLAVVWIAGCAVGFVYQLFAAYGKGLF